MPLPHTLNRKLSFRKPKQDFVSGKSHSRHFPSAPTMVYSRLTLQTQKLLHGRLPPAHGTLQPHQVEWLTFYLSQPIDTELLTTKIAALGPPLTRHMYSHAPNCLCSVHTWLELRWVEELMAVVGEEMGPSLEKLRGAPRELLSRPTKKHMRRLEDYRHLFPVVDPTTGALPTVKRDDCTRPGCSICNITTCKACKLSHFFQNAKAVRALEIVAKGRKKRGGAWPETCAWLDPKPGPNWEARWRRQANYVLKDRSNVNKWLKQGGWENTTSERYSSEIDMRAEHCESNVLDENGDEKLPGERPVSFIPSFKEMTPSPPGSPYGSPPGSPSVSSSGSPYRSLSDWGKDMTPSSASSVRNSTYTWESKILDEYALDPKRWCFDENATKEEVLTNLKKMGEEEDDSDDDSKDHMQRGEIKPNDRAVSYANVIGDLTPTQSTFVLPQAPKLEFPDRPERVEEAEGEEEYDWDEDDDEEETLLVGRKADEWAGSYTNLIGNMPPTQSNLALPQFDDRRSYTDTTPLVGRRQPGPHC